MNGTKIRIAGPFDADCSNNRINLLAGQSVDGVILHATFRGDVLVRADVDLGDPYGWASVPGSVVGDAVVLELGPAEALPSVARVEPDAVSALLAELVTVRAELAALSARVDSIAAR